MKISVEVEYSNVPATKAELEGAAKTINDTVLKQINIEAVCRGIHFNDIVEQMPDKIHGFLKTWALQQYKDKYTEMLLEKLRSQVGVIQITEGYMNEKR